MTDLHKAVLAADEEYLISISNKGIYKRACKDTENETTSYEETGDQIRTETGGESVVLSLPLETSICSCVSRSVCRHIIGAVILVKKSLSENEEAEEACPDNEISTDDADKTESVTENSSDGTSASDPDDNSGIQEDTNSESNFISDTDKKKIKSCAEDSLGILSDILVRGLTRLHENTPESLEIAAVRCHSLRMADAERMLRDLGSRFSQFTSGRSLFNMNQFTSKFLECAYELNKLCKQCDGYITEEMLGDFRRGYTEIPGETVILPVGMRKVSGGEYEGDVFYFLDVTPENERRFLSFSDMRPVFYDNVKKRPVYSHAVPWNLTVPLEKMMQKKMTLINVKLSEGRLSSSKETRLAFHVAANLDCAEIKNMVVFDFCQLVEELSVRDPKNELERMFFICPEKCLDSRFDTDKQMYRMTLQDRAGHSAEITAMYSEKSKNFITVLERIGKKYYESPDNKIIILAMAEITDGKLTLFPVEFYDFITPSPYEEYQLKSESIIQSGMYSEILLGCLGKVSDYTESVLQCGLSSVTGSDRKLVSLTSDLKMKGLTALISDFSDNAASYRHSLKNNSSEILVKMAELENYISTAKQKLEYRSALANLKITL